MRVGICGGGLGGLSAAIGLASLGFDVEVFEKSPTLRATGAGLNLWPNAGRALYGLGLRAQYDAISVKLDRYLGYSSDGTPLFNNDTSNWPETYGAPSVGVYRLALSTMLADAFGRDKIKFGHEVQSIEDKGDKAVCHFTNGASYEGDVIIGADGIYSVIREKLIGGVNFRPNDHHAFRWRAVIDLKDVDVDPAAQTGFYTSGGWLSVIPIGNGKAYWFGSVSGAKSLDDFIAFFSTWTNTHIPRTLRITPRDTIVESPLFDVDGVPYKWTHGRVTLLGDAAHPMMPDMAQGASQTFIDALALRDACAKTKDIDQALHDYEAERRPAANYVVKCSQRGSFLGRNNVSPVAVRYVQEIETQAA
ncbi:FAD-dependent monooxygenase [Aquabacter spiritensis]|uniref:2-polyprenyl-6-methoxyphenol hydroxylase-like FAD-dependent oxidoreductase n=1 Tax=Aquabacter spiritensis TaxID=933073 RepID=A0A4R3LPT1_9HYPH|nr:FAD-dependent monooxygenase [Aquabacter spiritensis]TCT02191.1 2-polyprenyl-6-methoxyphenol hydroxylase-like FAD-dependent oxidoreductase [Aquabacter spiritensis]